MILKKTTSKIERTDSNMSKNKFLFTKRKFSMLSILFPIVNIFKVCSTYRWKLKECATTWQRCSKKQAPSKKKHKNMKRYCKKLPLCQFWGEQAIVHQLNVVKYRRGCTYKSREVNRTSNVRLHNDWEESRLTKEACRTNQ